LPPDLRVGFYRISEKETGNFWGVGKHSHPLLNQRDDFQQQIIIDSETGTG
jgi:hypothetical protein